LKSLNVSSDKSLNWELFEKNIQCLKDNHGETFRRVSKAIEQFRTNPYEDESRIFTVASTHLESLNIFIEEKQTGQKYFYHEANPLEETRRIMEEAKLDHPQIVFFLGFGLGYMPLQFYNNRPDKNYAMLVVEPDPRIFLIGLLNQDFSEFFSDSDTSLLIGLPVDGLRGTLLGVFLKCLVVCTYIKVLPVPSALKLNAGYFQKFLETAMASRDVVIMGGGNSIEDSFIGVENMIENLDVSIENIGISPLENIAEGKTIVSVASGPSTDQHWDQIKAIAGKFPIIVCDSSLKAMLKRGIIPDYVTALERTSIVTGFFQDVEIPERTSLITPPLLLKESIEAFKGRKILYCPTVNGAAGIGFNILGLLNSGSSAGNLNISFACHLGFKNIIMVGHNLAYDYETRTSHIKGTFDVRQETPYTEEELKSLSKGFTVKTSDGTGEVYSNLFWNQFRTQMEGLISEKPNVNFINVAAKGARIEGTKLMKFEDAAQQFEDGACDLYEIQKNVLPLSIDEVSKSKEHFRTIFKESFECIKKWQNTTERLQRKIAIWESEILNRESLDRKVSLHYLDDALDEILKVKVAAVNGDPRFCNCFISVISAAHLAFESEINTMPARYTTNYELKRDFILRHKQYFEIWLKWMPRALKAYEFGIAQTN